MTHEVSHRGVWVREGLALLRPPSRGRPISVASARIGCGFRAEPSTNQPHVQGLSHRPCPILHPALPRLPFPPSWSRDSNYLTFCHHTMKGGRKNERRKMKENSTPRGSSFDMEREGEDENTNDIALCRPSLLAGVTQSSSSPAVRGYERYMEHLDRYCAFSLSIRRSLSGFFVFGPSARRIDYSAWGVVVVVVGKGSNRFFRVKILMQRMNGSPESEKERRRKHQCANRSRKKQYPPIQG